MTDDRPPWFPCEPGKLLGALQAMKPHVAYTYWVVCLRCYEVGGPMPDSLDAIARRTGYSKRVVSDALAELFRTEKLLRVPEGIINPYAERVLDDIAHRREGQSAGGREGARRRWGKTQGNQTALNGSPKPDPMASDAQLQLQVQEQESSSEPRAKRHARRAVVRADWMPDDHGRLYAKSQGFKDDATIDRMSLAFRRHHRSRGTLFADNAAGSWENWVDIEVKIEARKSGGGQQKGPTMFELATRGGIDG